MPYKNPEDRRANYRKNKEKILARNKAWNEANKEQLTQYRKDNAERRKATTKAWREKNKEHVKNYSKKYEAENKDKRKAYRKNNKAASNAKTIRYQQLKKENNYIITELDKLVEYEMYELAQRRTIELGFEWEVDHTIPLSKGGPHAIHNLQVVPMAWNRSKCNRHNESFRLAA